MQSPSDRRPSALNSDIGLAPGHFVAAALSALLWAGLCLLAALGAPSARAQTVPGGSTPGADVQALQAQVEAVLKQQPVASASNGGAQNQKQAWRVEVSLGQLDPRLKLAPCDKVRAYMPDGVQMWGKTRVGLRCEQGAVHWNVFWPVTVKVFGQALVAAVPLRPGAPLEAGDLRVAEVDLAERSAPALTRVSDVVGRAVVRGIDPGKAIRQDDLKARRWFAAGDPVSLTVKGQGFQIAAEGMALSNGDEGQCARVRTDNGRVLCGHPVGDRQVELSL